MVAEIENSREVFVDGQFTVEAMPDLVKPYVLATEQLLFNIRPFGGKRTGEDQFADKFDLRHFRLAEDRLCLVVFHVMPKNCFWSNDCTKIHINIYIKCTIQDDECEKNV